MLESFYLQRYQNVIDARWREKNLISAEILGCGPFRQMRPNLVGDRSRIDLMWNGSALGIRGPTQEQGTFEFFEIEEPDSVQPAIVEMMKFFCKIQPPLGLAQIRFRNSANGSKKGIWIDTSNEEIKNFLGQEKYLRHFFDRGWVIELGQKHKAIEEREGRLKLGEPRPDEWLSSFDINNEELPLLSYVSLFSQPGPEVNRALIACGFELLDEARIEKLSWCEWGAGYGNLSAAYASRLGQEHAWASELDKASAELLAENAQRFFPRVQTEKRAAEHAQLNYDLWLADPPRPGFPKLFAELRTLSKKPTWILVYHCHNSGLLSDSRLLKEAGYTLFQWSSVDAFPATPHHEVISLWRHS